MSFTAKLIGLLSVLNGVLHIHPLTGKGLGLSDRFIGQKLGRLGKAVGHSQPIKLYMRKTSLKQSCGAKDPRKGTDLDRPW